MGGVVQNGPSPLHNRGLPDPKHQRQGIAQVLSWTTSLKSLGSLSHTS